MASLHKDQKSPFWYLRFRDPADGKWKSKATPFRHSVAAETRRARQIESETTNTERTGPRVSPVWSKWVQPWIKSRYTDKLSRARVGACWTIIGTFFAERSIWHPAQVERQHCYEYFEWRKKGGVKRKPAHHNTALLEIKILGMIMGESMHRGYVTVNPAARLGIKKMPPKEKPALTDDEITILQAEFEKMDSESVARGGHAWMTRCFKIALCQGVRLTETQVPLSDVHLDGNVIVFSKTKGNKPYGAPIHPALRGDLEKWITAGEKVTCVLPAQASRIFHRAFKQLGIKNSFHATRVTVATRLAIAGVDERLARLYLNHASTLVHSIYVRLRPEHAIGVTSALVYPGHSAPALDESP